MRGTDIAYATAPHQVTVHTDRQRAQLTRVLSPAISDTAIRQPLVLLSCYCMLLQYAAKLLQYAANVCCCMLLLYAATGRGAAIALHCRTTRTRAARSVLSQIGTEPD
eukprot:1519812-Rhodomonas_salina.1